MTANIDPNEPMEDIIQVRLARLVDVLHQLGRYSLAGVGLRTTDLRILNLLFDRGKLSINELARRAHVDKAWISRSIEQLMNKRWVSKQAHPTDARAQLICLTPKSMAMLEKLRPQVLLNERSLLKGLNEQKLKRQLDHLMQNADDLLASKKGVKTTTRKR